MPSDTPNREELNRGDSTTLVPPRRKGGPISGETLAAVGFFAWSLAILCLLAGATFVLSVKHPNDQHWNLTTLCLALGGMLAFGAALLLIMGAVRWAMTGTSLAELKEIKTTLRDRDRLLQVLVERTGQSEVAKRIASREQDIAALRQAIHEDIARRSFDGALVLVNELSQTFGYRYEAEQFREQIAGARKSEMDQKVAAAIASLDEVIGRHEWDRALAEADKIQRLYPDAPDIRGLTKRVREAREQHKHELEREFLEAAQRDEVDRAIELLKHLDKYLTSAEAEPFRETARGVIGKKRDNLGVQFKMAVHDKEWTQAVRVGEQIIRDFPNTKMADEVRGLLDVVRERAAAQQAARVP